MTIKRLYSNKIITFAFLISLLFIFSCIEEYKINISEEYDNTIVISGKITNLPGPYTISISTSTSLTQQEYKPVRQATVQIVDDLGNSETLTEVKHGTYQTSESGIQGIVGRSYKVIIQTHGGGNYESEFQELLAPVGIESINYQVENRFAPNLYPDLDYIDGIQFYVTTETSEINKNYFYWELEETWEIRSKWEITFMYYPKGLNYDHTKKTVIPQRSDSLFYCWKTINENFNTSNTNHTSIPKLTNFPLHFVSIHTERLKHKYSLLLHQFTVSEHAHLYLKALINQDDGQEGLYTKQPYQIQGNIYNLNKPDQIVLGYFMVASTSNTKRLTLPKPANIGSRWHLPCENIDIVHVFGPQKYPYYAKQYGPFYVTRTNYYDRELKAWRTGNIVPPLECIDCTSRDAVLKKPDYWDQ